MLRSRVNSSTPWVARARSRLHATFSGSIRRHTTQQNILPARNFPKAQGLYNPLTEKDACGVGFVVDIKGRPSHQIVTNANDVLVNMTHRGASGCEVNAGDGAGMMVAIPHDFLTKEMLNAGVVLPPQGEYAAGMVFLNKDAAIRAESKAKFKTLADKAGLEVLGWRAVPTNNGDLGETARLHEPAIEQVFVAPRKKVDEEGRAIANNVGRMAYHLGKMASREIAEVDETFYLCSMSPTTMVYKGQLTCGQLFPYFSDLQDPLFVSHFATVHSRFATNTFPSWERAQPTRVLAHNGEINTLRGNVNAMTAREGALSSPAFGDNLSSLFPICEPRGSDSAMLDNVAEFMMQNGRTLPEVMMMLVPEAWENSTTMPKRRKAFYEWASNVMEPWDGPALLTFSDGRYIGAILDRNGLRPARYYVTNDDKMIMASEVGTVHVDNSTIVTKGNLAPGRMLLVDTAEGHIVPDSAIKREVARAHPYDEWINEKLPLDKLVEERHPMLQGDAEAARALDLTPISPEGMSVFHYTSEHFNLLLAPMMATGKEALGSMGNDVPLACLSKMPRLPYEYFKQLFAQVTNPPIDPFRERIVMSLRAPIGPQRNFLASERAQCARVTIDSPVLTPRQADALRHIDTVREGWSSKIIDTTYPDKLGPAGLSEALDRICEDVVAAIKEGHSFAYLSDRHIAKDRVPASSLFVVGAVHQRLIREKLRGNIGLIVESGDAREVHHHCMLLGYGADAIYPYNAYNAIHNLKGDHRLQDLTDEQMVSNYVKAVDTGILKVMAKMGISTLASYKGAQIFEGVGVHQSVIDKCFTGTLSRISGKSFDHFGHQALKLHEWAFEGGRGAPADVLNPGDYHWRQGGETHVNSPAMIANLQEAVRARNQVTYDKFALGHKMAIQDATIRGQLNFIYQPGMKIPMEEIEPAKSIVKRFVTGAMSFGSISQEAHEALARAMNTLGGRSNTGEGGEAPERYSDPLLRSSIKQVASGRFGVTIDYLANSDEIQIKMAQGAKPGEGGELPGYKVIGDIAATRRSTPGVGLISPPPHHDIYSIEDLAQLIMDLKCSNPTARISVKLVSLGGVGVIATGVAKTLADHILISGHDGGTGASSWTGVKHAGLPWELGLAETHQTLVLNGLRGRVMLQTDGQLRTGRDVVMAALLGAEEYGFSTAPLLALGCTMMRKCHLNTCPVGIATQDPDLRKKFEGQPEHVVDYFFMVAEEVRRIMSRLGFRTVNEMIGRTDMLTSTKKDRQGRPYDPDLDLKQLLVPAYTMRGGDVYCRTKQDHKVNEQLELTFMDRLKAAINEKKPVKLEATLKNTDRVFGTMLSYEIAKRYGADGLPDDTIHFKLSGNAGQSLGAFLAKGVTLELEGDANDYVGKGLSGGRIVAYPPKHADSFVPEKNSIVGNVCLYGATSGEAFFRGIASNRFCVRNSGATAVVEGVGDHACEYMTGGRVVVLGPTGRNFAAGMSGGIAYVLRSVGDTSFTNKLNPELVKLEAVDDGAEANWLRHLLTKHVKYTGSTVAAQLLQDWEGSSVDKFIKVMPVDYKRALEEATADAERKRLTMRLEALRQESARIRADLQLIENGGIPSVAPPPAEPEPEIVLPKPTVVTGPLDKIRGFKLYGRQSTPLRDPAVRVTDWEEINLPAKEEDLKVQTARCMDCGVPFCMSAAVSGCPLGNIIPSFNDLVHQGKWREALDELHRTNNFPEFTGRACPAPCEGACVLGINEDPVAIKSVESAIIDRGFEEGWVVPRPPAVRTGKKIAIVGSGPAGLAAADQLNKAGHSVTVFERADRIGGLLTYGIPNMKLDKKVVQRRVDLLAAEGIEFVTNTEVGVNLDPKELRDNHDAVLLTVGATQPRDIPVPGRDSEGIFYAMDYLEPSTKMFLGAPKEKFQKLNAKGKKVVVIGGGDTGVDCIATALRQGAKSITTFEILDKPPATRGEGNEWPRFPRVLKTDYGHAEVMVQTGKDPRQFSVMTKEFVQGVDGSVEGVNVVDVKWEKDANGVSRPVEVPNSYRRVDADLVLLAAGFTGPQSRIAQSLGLPTDSRSNFKSMQTGLYKTEKDNKIYIAGDCRRGQSLIVWAISEGRQAALEMDMDLMGRSSLPQQGGTINPLDLVNRPRRRGTLRRQLGFASKEQTDSNWL